jgi:outer membrane cobalamin receptor
MLVSLLTTFSLLFMPSVHADSARGDTVKLNVVTVIGDTWLDNRVDVSVPITSLDRQMLARLAPVAITDALPMIPGAFTRDYGGVGGLKTFSMRGGSSSQSLVVVDGARLSSAQTGTVDLSLIPARLIESLRVIRGGASALYGANAVNGVLDLILHTESTPSARAYALIGSFNEWRMGAGATASLSSAASLSVDVERLGTAGSFPFTLNEFGTTYDVNRTNSDARSTSAVMRARVHDASLTVLARTSERGVPGSVVQGSVTNARARFADDDVVAMLTLPLHAIDALPLVVTSTVRWLDQHYTDPEATLLGPAGIDARTTQHDLTLGVTTKPLTIGRATSTTRVDVGYADLTGDEVLDRPGAVVTRRSVAFATDWTLSDVVVDDLDVRAALRIDAFSDVGAAVSPLVAIDYPLGGVVRASWSYNFRPPTFAELYVLNYGTRSLVPERSHTVNLGYALPITSWLSCDVDAYWMSTSNLIVSVPVSPLLTTAQNVGRAITYGAELMLRGSWFDDRLRAQWAYTRQSVQDATGRAGIDGTMIPYAVPELSSIFMQWTDAITPSDAMWNAGATWSYTSYRYAQAGGTYASLLQPFAVTSIFGGVDVRSSRTVVHVRAQCDNLFDAQYAVIRGFPMPGRSFRVTTSVEVAP